MKLRHRLELGAVGLVLAVGVAWVALTALSVRREFGRETDLRAMTVARHLAREVADPVLTENRFRLGMLLSEAREKEPGVRYAYVERGGAVLAHTFEAGVPEALRSVAPSAGTRRLRTPEGEVVHAAQPVLDGLAVVHVGIDAAPLGAAARALTLQTVGLAGLVVLGAGLLAVFLVARVMRPLEGLTAVAEAVAAGDWSRRPEARGTGEVARLADAFGRMLDRLEESHRRLEDANVELEREIEAHRQAEERNRVLQEQLLRAQRLEAVGQLAGGIAHEFNNLLAAVLSAAELAIRRLGSDHPEARRLQTIVEAAERGGALTRRLLAFSQRQVLVKRRLDPNRLLEETAALLGPTLGEAVRLEVRAEGRVPLVRADPEQIRQVLVSLATNARDAMAPEGGRLLFVTRRVEDEGREWAEIEVTDEGKGIPPGDLDRIFDPFFTTKEVGKGTGLGLAAAYGIVQQHGGDLRVESALGKGTTFRILLPGA